MLQPSKRRVALYIGLLLLYFAAMTRYRHEVVSSWTSETTENEDTAVEVVEVARYDLRYKLQHTRPF